MTDQSYIVIGKIGSTHGIHGWLKIIAYTEYGPTILDYSPWYLSSEKTEPVATKIEEGHVQGKNILVKFKDINTPEEAARLTGRTISILRSQLPALNQDEFYWSDLVGLNVINKNGLNFGKVIYLMATGSNDVLVVKGEKEHAIPFLWNSVILKVDLKKGEILVDWEPI